MSKPVYKRVLVKISGEALKNGCETDILDFDFVDKVVNSIEKCLKEGVEVAVIVGAGNIWRGARKGVGMNRARADHMGMLATVINCMAVADSLEQRGVEVRVQTAIEMSRIAEPYIRGKAIRHLEKTIQYAQGNVSPAAICGYLSWNLR